MATVGDTFGAVTSGVAWLSIVLRVAQFLLFSESAAWRKVTFGVLAALLALVAITSGLKVT